MATNPLTRPVPKTLLDFHRDLQRRRVRNLTNWLSMKDEKVRLPIEYVPGTNPPKFRWRQRVEMLEGKARSYKHEGVVPVNLEGALYELVKLATSQQEEIAALKKQVEGHCERIAAQSEILSQKVEKPPANSKEQVENIMRPISPPAKKGK